MILPFPIGSTVAIQYEDGKPWMHRVIKEPNSSDHRRRSYIIRVTKIGRLITQNIRHICSTPVTTEKYLWGQIKKERHFYADSASRAQQSSRSHTAEPRVHVSHGKTTVCKKEGKRDNFIPLNRVRRAVAGMLHAMTNQTTSQLTTCQQTWPQKAAHTL